MRDNAKRRADRARRKQLFERLRLQSELLCESYKSEAKSSVILGRMLLIVLDIVGRRNLNVASREALANHFTDSAVPGGGASVQLGGTNERDALHLSGVFNIGDLAKRITWSEARTGQTIEVDHAN